MTKTKGTTQKSSQSKSQQPDYTRPISKWRRIECETFAKEQGIELAGKSVQEQRGILKKLKKDSDISFPGTGKQNGGTRENSGRKKLDERERLETLKTQAEEHALGEAIVTINDGMTIKKVKMQRSLALLDVLFTEGVRKKNISAIKEYFDRTRGKARQPVEHSGEIKTEDQYIPDDPATMKAYDTYKKERKKLIAQGYYEQED